MLLGYLFKSKIVFFILAILLFLFLRSVYYTEHLNFSADQGEHAAQVLELYRQHKIPLIGNPITSTVFQGHMIFQGPAYYYMLFVFLFLGNWDPIASSYLFTIFCGIMIIPLYYGVKLLINERSAILISIVYICFPYYLEYTRFHWNPNYQFSLLPLLILLMGLYRKKKSKLIFLSISIFLGILLQFHYQFIFVIFILGFYYLFVEKVNKIYSVYFVLGILIGLSPLILFELRNKFYNLNTLFLFLNHRNEISSAGGITTPHYYISISFIILIGLLELFSKRIPKGKIFTYLCASIAAVFCVWSIVINFHKTDTAFWSFANHWSYPDEYKVYQIIKNYHISDYNIANLTYYDTKSAVIKYLLKRDQVKINYDDYYGNKFLFVIKASNNQLFNTSSYEVAFFKPSVLLRTWKINKYYNLYLLKREVN